MFDAGVVVVKRNDGMAQLAVQSVSFPEGQSGNSAPGVSVRRPISSETTRRQSPKGESEFALKQESHTALVTFINIDAIVRE